MELKILRSEGGGSHDNLFALSGKRIKLVKPLDRDENDLSSIMFQVELLYKQLVAIGSMGGDDTLLVLARSRARLCQRVGNAPSPS